MSPEAIPMLSKSNDVFSVFRNGLSVSNNMRNVLLNTVFIGSIFFSTSATGQYDYGTSHNPIQRYPLNSSGSAAGSPVQTHRPSPSVGYQRLYTPAVNTQIRPPYVANNQPYVANNQPYVANNQPYVANNQPYVANNQPYVANNRPYGYPSRRWQDDIAPAVDPLVPANGRRVPGQYRLNPLPRVQNAPNQPTTELLPSPVRNQNPPLAVQPPNAAYPSAPYVKSPQIQQPATVPYQPNGEYANPGPYQAGPNDPYFANGIPNTDYYGNPAYPGQLYGPGVQPNLFGNFFNGGRGCRPVISNWRRSGTWYAGVGGLVFNRDFEDDISFAYPLGFPLTDILVSTDADSGSMGGVEVFIGKRFCNGYGIEFGYWGLFADDAIAQTNGGSPQTAIASFSRLSYNNGGGASGVDGFLNAAATYRLERRNEIHNLELNFLVQTFAARQYNCCTTDCGPSDCGNYNNTGCGINGCGPNYGSGRPGLFGNAGLAGCNPRPFRMDLLAGVRYFKFDEDFIFRTSTTGDFSSNVNDIYYDIDVDNDLVGVQLGGNIEFCLFPCWTISGGTRLGVYGNQMNQRSRIFGTEANAYANVGPNTGQDFDLSSTKTDVSFLGQFDLGLNYRLNCHWDFGVGYRVVAVNGVALAPEQIPLDLSRYQDVNAIDSNSGLILHGAYFRARYNF
jgi:hypothetical protein